MSQNVYSLRFYDTAGVLQAIVDDFRYLEYSRRVNAPGAVRFGLAGDHRILADIADKWRVDVWRKPAGGAWRRELMALFRDEEWSYLEAGSAFEGYAPGVMSLLGWRIVNYPAGVDGRSMFLNDPAETVMKALVRLNAGSQATVATYGRKRDATNLGITTAAESGRGNAVDWYCHGDNLLETLQELARIGGGDFDLYPTSQTAFVFEFYPGRLGDDLSATLTFAMNRGNMAEPTFSVVRSTERTVAAVYGQGEGTDRDYVTRTGAHYSSSYDAELYVDAKDIDKGDTASLQARGDTKLDEAEARETFSFKARQTESAAYGVDYDLGDLASAVNPFNGATYTVQVKAVEVSFEPGGKENINVEVATQ